MTKAMEAAREIRLLHENRNHVVINLSTEEIAAIISKHFPEADSAVGQAEVKAGHFDICKEMARRGMDIRMSLLENITNLSYDGNIVVGIRLDNKFIGGLLLCDREQYYAVARELEAAPSTQPSTTESKK